MRLCETIDDVSSRNLPKPRVLFSVGDQTVGDHSVSDQTVGTFNYIYIPQIIAVKQYRQERGKGDPV